MSCLKFRFAIDRGGTFTDIFSECSNGEIRVMKLLSIDAAYPDAPREGIRRILEEVGLGRTNHAFSTKEGESCERGWQRVFS